MKEKKYISLVSDTTIKYLCKEERFRPFINRIVYLVTGMDIKDYKLIDNELNSGNDRKDYRLDLLFEKDNQLVSIEMNRYPNEYVERKNHQYLYRLAGSGYLKGEEYKEKYVTQINFNKGVCKNDEDIGYICYEFQNTEHNLKIEGIKDYEIYLGKYKGICYTKEKERESYLSFMNSESYEEMKKIGQGNEEMEEIEKELERLGIEDKWNAIYDAEIVQKKLENSARSLGYKEGVEKGLEQGIDIGKKEGKEEGIAEERKEIAITMLQKKMDYEIISECTGLSKEEIENLQ